QKGISCRLWRWREIRHTEGTCQSFVACSDQAACEKPGQRRWLIGVLAAERERCEARYSSKHSSRHGEQAVRNSKRRRCYKSAAEDSESVREQADASTLRKTT